MKICWDNLEELHYNKKTGKIYDKHGCPYIEIDSCKTCGESFLSQGEEGLYCSRKCTGKDLEWRRKNSAAQKIAQNRPEVKAKHSAALKEAMNKPEYKIKRSAIAKELWEDPEYRAKVVGALNRPEARAKNSAVTKEAMNRPEVKAKISAIIKELWKDPEYRAKHLGENNGSYIDGKSYEEYCPVWGDQEYKENLKERDNHQCQNPFCWKKNKTIILHHINYNKKDCRPDNIATTCRSCNARANFNRDLWQFIYSWLTISKKFNIQIKFHETFKNLLEIQKQKKENQKCQ